MLHAGVHTLRADFTPLNPEMYRPATISVQITVHMAHPLIRWTAPRALFEGMAIAGAQCVCVCVTPGEQGGIFTYTPARGTVFTKAGKYKIHVSFEPHDKVNYLPAEETLELAVHPAIKPVLYWSELESITYPTQLSRVQLGCRCTNVGVKGEMFYDPDVGKYRSTKFILGMSCLFFTFECLFDLFVPFVEAYCPFL